ncbi:MAG: glycerol-3-phosphate 1-O-acyltransferase PlsY [Deltaproteobacteria bacterium]|jgi:glycerol-3-phosphate acyltransferase PlsY|nr:glycerol-3-phosphate 1-O-acyltransferase PlsY [Deltaproteobacteria bacterium]
MIKYLVLPIFGYLLGSIPWGLILTRLFTPINIRQAGSGNIGATNVARLTGPVLGALTLVGDIFKGAFPVWLAISITTQNDVWGALYVALVAIAAFTGHLYPVYLKFKNGGKGVATAAGCFGVISPVALVILILVFIMFVCWSNRVSLASLAAAAVLPVAIWKTTGSEVMLGCAVTTAIFIYFRHTDNIKRLLAGTEPPIWK